MGVVILILHLLLSHEFAFGLRSSGNENDDAPCRETDQAAEQWLGRLTAATQDKSLGKIEFGKKAVRSIRSLDDLIQDADEKGCEMPGDAIMTALEEAREEMERRLTGKLRKKLRKIMGKTRSSWDKLAGELDALERECELAGAGEHFEKLTEKDSLLQIEPVLLWCLSAFFFIAIFYMLIMSITRRRLHENRAISYTTVLKNRGIALAQARLRATTAMMTELELEKMATRLAAFGGEEAQLSERVGPFLDCVEGAAVEHVSFQKCKPVAPISWDVQ